MLHRVRALMRFPTSSGMATWARDNMAVRYEQAVHIRPGEAAEEAPANVVTDDGDRQVFRCDLPLMDGAHAQDAVETLAAVFPWSEPHPSEDGPEPSWVEYHQCDHADDNRDGCVVIDRREA